MTCSGYPLDSLDSVDRNGKSGMRVINEIQRKKEFGTECTDNTNKRS